MKKISKILGVIACAFVFMLSGALLTACGGAAPFNVKGVSLKGTAECILVWGEEISEQDKQDIYAENDITSEEELNAMYSNWLGEQIKTYTYTYNTDGTLLIKAFAEGETHEIEGYYAQSEDLKTITNYHDAEHTSVFSDGLGGLEWHEDSYCCEIFSDTTITVYFVFERV